MQCCEWVFMRHGRNLTDIQGGHQCTRQAKWLKNGKPYCARHAEWLPATPLRMARKLTRVEIAAQLTPIKENA